MNIIIFFFTLLFIQLTQSRTAKVFQSNYETMTMEIQSAGLKHIKQMDSVIPITVIGSRKSGKSYLMNQLTKTNSFDLGHMAYPKTKGIDILTKRKEINDKDIIYFDTEGLSSNPSGFDKNIILDISVLN